MKAKVNEKGQALVIVLFFSTIALLMVAAVLYMVLRGTSMSGVQKRYQTALDAGYAGVGTGTGFLDSGLFYSIDSPATNPVFLTAGSTPSTVVSSGTLTITSAAGTCFFDKIFTPFNASTGLWDAATASGSCTAADSTIDPTENPDIEYAVTGATGRNYYVYTKIVDSRAGITAQRPPGGIEVARGFANPTGTQGLNIQQQAYFYYTVEVLAQETSDTTGETRETAQISFDYAY